MIIFVKDSRNRILSPTTKVDWMNKILKRGRGRLICRKSILVQLNYPVTSESNDEYFYSIGLDTGYSNIGFCVIKQSKSKFMFLFKGTFELRTAEITKNLTERKMYRQIRRRNRRINCKFRKFRKPRWKNRKSDRKLNPSMKHLFDSHINIVKYILKYIEFKKIILNLEYAKFDSQKISGVGNSDGEGVNSNFNNTKVFVLHRDNYTCQKCKKTKIPLQVHHIIFRSRGGSDRSENLITLCVKCHSDVHSKSTHTSFKVGSTSYKDLGLLNSTMKYIYDAFKIYIPTYKYFGYETKSYRESNLKLSKSHSNDALALSLMCDNIDFQNKKIINSNINLNLKQYRRHNRAATKRIEDRKYYFGKEIIARNRRPRTGQTYDSLIEMRRAYLDVALKVKLGRVVYENRTRNKPFTPGDVLSNGEVVTGFSSTQRRVFSKTSYYKFKDITRIRRNSGLTVC